MESSLKERLDGGGEASIVRGKRKTISKFLQYCNHSGYPSLSNVAVRLRGNRIRRWQRWFVLPRPRVHGELRGGDANDFKTKKITHFVPIFCDYIILLMISLSSLPWITTAWLQCLNERKVAVVFLPSQESSSSRRRKKAGFKYSLEEKRKS